jgi:hypothetical protein
VNTRFAPRALAVLVVAVLQRSTLDAWFATDDFLHLYQLTNTDLAQFVLTPHAGHVYLVRNTIFAAAHALFGLDARLYLYALLATHLVNVVLLHVILERARAPRWLAFAGAIAWGGSLLHRDSLQWYTAHGLILVATVLLVFLFEVQRVRENRLVPERRVILRWMALLLAGSTCYGTGIAVAMLAPLIAYLLIPAERGGRGVALKLLPVVALVPLLYAVVYWMVPEAEAQAQGEATQFFFRDPVIWSFAALSTLTLHGYAVAGLLLGPFAVVDPQGIIAGPLAGGSVDVSMRLWIAVALAVAVLLAMGWQRASRGNRGLAAVGLLVAASSYGLIAIGRAKFLILMALPVQVATTPRYHYVGTLGITLAVVWGLSQFGAQGEAVSRSRSRSRALAATVAWVLVTSATAFVTGKVIHSTGARARPHYERAIQRIELTLRAAEVGRTVCIRNRPFAAHPFGGFPGWAAVYVITHPSDVFEGRTVRFVDGDAERVRRARAARPNRAATLLLTEAERSVCGPRRQRQVQAAPTDS